MTILRLHEEPLQDAWLDAYGHLNEAYYLVPFSNATWKVQEHFGIGIPYFEDTGCAIYTVETHLRYLKDVRVPATMEVESLILGSGPGKIWFAHRMQVDGTVCATGEFMLLHYDTGRGQVTPMPASVQERLKAAEVSELPDWAGRSISLNRA